MNGFEIHVPAKHVAWLQQLVTEEASCDVEESAPGWTDMTQADLEETVAIAQRAIGILAQLGYPSEGEESREQDRVVEVDPPYAAYLVEQGIERIGEDMKVASGGYEADPANPEAMREVSARTDWLIDLSVKIEGVEADRKLTVAP